MRPRRRSNPSTCHLRSACNGRSFPLSQPPRYPRHPPVVLQPPQLLRQPLHSYGRRRLFSSGEAFHSRNSSASTTTMRTTENTTKKDKLTFDLCKTSDSMKVLASPRSSTFFALPQKTGRIFTHTAYLRLRKLAPNVAFNNTILRLTKLRKMYQLL